MFSVDTESKYLSRSRKKRKKTHLILLPLDFLILWHLYSRTMIGNVSFICFLMVTVWCLFGSVCHAGKKFFTENEVFFFSLFKLLCKNLY